MNISAIASTIAPVDLRSCLISQNGGLVFEHYRHPRIPDEKAKVNSCTKSFLSALICIAMDQGILPGSETPIIEFFPQLRSASDSRKREITLEHLLTMSAGFEWSEFGGIKSFPRMTRTGNWVEFVLEQPISDTPGTRMEYSSGCSQLLSAILVQAAGKSTARHAEENLFGPLGIEDYRWESDPQGIHTGGYGLWLRPGDLLRFGQLYLQQGRWEQRQLIPRELVNRSVQPSIPAGPPNRGFYGWHWWTDTFEAGLGGHSAAASPLSFDYFYARGYAGQFIYIVPFLETIVVLTDDKRKKERHPANVFRDFIAPLLLEDLN